MSTTTTWEKFCDNKTADFLIASLIFILCFVLWFIVLFLNFDEHNMLFGWIGGVMSALYGVIATVTMYVSEYDSPRALEPFHGWLEEIAGKQLPKHTSGALGSFAVAVALMLGFSSLTLEEESQIKTIGPDKVLRGFGFNNPLRYDVRPVAKDYTLAIDLVAPTLAESKSSLGIKGWVNFEIDESPNVIAWTWNGQLDNKLVETYMHPALVRAVQSASTLTIPEIEAAAAEEIRKIDNDAVLFRQIDIGTTYGI